MEDALYYVVLLCMVGYFWNDKLALAHIQIQKAKQSLKVIKMVMLISNGPCALNRHSELRR